MASQFDAALKDLARAHPHGFVNAFDQPTSLPLALLNVDLSTITRAADFVVGLGDPPQEIVHFEFQSSASATKHRDILVYNAVLHKLYEVPVHSIVILLRPQAAHSNLDGAVNYAARPGQGKMNFAYQVVRLWEVPTETLLASDVGVVPLAPLGLLPGDVSEMEGMADVARRIVERLNRDASLERKGELLTAAFVLSGMRIQADIAEQLFQGAKGMKESSTYMSILEQGMEKGMKEILLRQGTKSFGSPSESIQSKMDAIHDVNQLESLADRLLNVSSWEELLGE